MSTGAVRIALKYDVPIMLVDIHRVAGGRHQLTAEPFVLSHTGDVQKDLDDNLKRMMVRYEAWVADHPAEYVWFYKTWKYARDRVVLILDDGRVGHLRQSQAVARACVAIGREKGITVSVQTVVVTFTGDIAARALPFFSGGDLIYAGADITALRPYVDAAALKVFESVRPDIVISCGARNAAVNWWVTRESRARSIAVLPNRILPAGIFDLVVLPEHDLSRGERPASNAVRTKAALNLIDKAYLDENARALLQRYQHLRQNVRTKMAVLIGGDAQGVVMTEQGMKVVLHQLRSAAVELGIDLLITTSRRTPPAVEQLVIREFRDHPRTALLIIASKTDVPEAVGGMLALADLVVVSAESISMVSEAASSGKRTIAFAVGPGKDHKYARFCEKLAAQGHIIYADPKGISGAIDSAVKNKIITKPLNDGAILTDALRKVL
jgi:mitochondrial fission protein ELM1